jgi:hypothetical protein
MKASLLTAALTALIIMSTGHVIAQSQADPAWDSAAFKRIDFNTATAKGYIKYLPSISKGYSRYVYVPLTLTTKVSFPCLNYGDFNFDLRSTVSGKQVPVSLQNLSHRVSTPSYDLVAPATQPGKQPVCLYPPTNGALVVFSLDDLYPNLPSGSYALTIRFAPQRQEAPWFTLPTIDFKITD